MLRADRIAPPLAAPPPPPAPAGVPWSHHEILRLVGPFTRSGRQADLAASDRAERVLRFRPQPRDGQLLETLSLQDLGRSGYALTRTLRAGDGREATLRAEGRDIDTLLAWVDAVPPAQHWQQGSGWRLALHHRLLAPPPKAAPGTPPQCVLARADAQLATLQLQASLSRVKNMPAELTLQAAPGLAADALRLPQDLLAVLGLPWSRLQRLGGQWRASLQLRGSGERRSADAQAKLQQALEHLAATLAAPASQFHARHAAARWRVTLRRGVPLLVCLGLIGSAAAVPWMGISNESVLKLLAFNAPPILMVWLFSMRELPRIEIPPLPRALSDGDWVPAVLPDAPCTPTP